MTIDSEASVWGRVLATAAQLIGRGHDGHFGVM